MRNPIRAKRGSERLPERIGGAGCADVDALVFAEVEAEADAEGAPSDGLVIVGSGSNRFGDEAL